MYQTFNGKKLPNFDIGAKEGLEVLKAAIELGI
jgi:hypothetical protein